MKTSREFKGMMLGVCSGVAAVSLAFAAGEIIQPKVTLVLDTSSALAIPANGTQERKGYELFLRNCAHCHGDDARGDEGPDLHAVAKSDARIASLIKNGVKGEMPKFGSKLDDEDVKSLAVFLRSLK
ncbi:MAG: cytochrome c oxidase, cbb3-type subunit [Verrucomicrobiales bacterium]|nr:cytochrome c oxidase, cbb3-type subunit [Verrucomicrobiales bacterium]